MISIHRLFCSISVLVALFGFCPLALADSTSIMPYEPVSRSEPSPETESYRLQILGADVLSFGLGLGAMRLFPTDAVGLLGILLWTVSSPIIHSAHGNKRSAGISQVLRLLVPVTSALVGYSYAEANAPPCDPKTSWCLGFEGLGGFFFGALLGFSAVTLIDVTMLAEKPVVAASQVSFMVLPTSGGARLAMGGRF